MDFMVNTWSPRQNGRHFADDIFDCIFWNENVWITIKISLNCVPKCPIKKAWRRSGDTPLSEPMTVSLLTHICVSWVQLNEISLWPSGIRHVIPSGIRANIRPIWGQHKAHLGPVGPGWAPMSTPWTLLSEGLSGPNISKCRGWKCEVGMFQMLNIITSYCGNFTHNRDM